MCIDSRLFYFIFLSLLSVTKSRVYSRAYSQNQTVLTTQPHAVFEPSLQRCPADRLIQVVGGQQPRARPRLWSAALVLTDAVILHMLTAAPHRSNKAAPAPHLRHVTPPPLQFRRRRRAPPAVTQRRHRLIALRTRPARRKKSALCGRQAVEKARSSSIRRLTALHGYDVAATEEITSTTRVCSECDVHSSVVVTYHCNTGAVFKIA